MKQPKPRQADLAKIHIARKDLSMDEATYRAMLWTVARVNTAKDLDHAGRQQVLQHLHGLGWRAKRKGHPGKVADNKQPLIKKIAALLTDMQLEWAYADGIARQMFKLDSVRFCKHEQLRKIVAALIYKQKNTH